MNDKAIVAVIVVILLAAVIGANYNMNQSEPSSYSGSLNIAGSTTVLPLNQEWARLLMEKYPNLRISVSGGGSGHGIKSVGSGETDIGASSRDVKDKEFNEYPDIKPVAVAKDSIAVIVHPSNPLTNIMMESIAKIYAGEVTNFKEIGGPDMKIDVYTREAGSGTREYFEEIVLKKFDKEIFRGASVKPSNGEMRASVVRNPRGFAYISIGFLDDTVKGLGIDGVEPTMANVKSSDYPIVRSLYLITKGEPSRLRKLFIDFALSPEGQAVVVEQGYISVS